MDDQIRAECAKLAAPVAPDQIAWRAGATNKDRSSALALPYLTSRAVMDRLDRVVGPDRWQVLHRAGPSAPKGSAEGLLTGIGIRFGARWVWKWDGADIDPQERDQKGEVVGSPSIKSALSDGIKRAAIQWGVGRDLYAIPKFWVKCRQQGRSVVLDEDPRIQLLRRAPWYAEKFEAARRAHPDVYGEDAPPEPGEEPPPEAPTAAQGQAEDLAARRRSLLPRLTRYRDGLESAGEDRAGAHRILEQQAGVRLFSDDGKLVLTMLDGEVCARLERVCARAEDAARAQRGAAA